MSMSVEQFQAIKERRKLHVSVAEDRDALIEHVEENHVQIARLKANVSGYAAANAEIARATGCSNAADIVAYVNGLQPEIAMYKKRGDIFKASLERTVSTVETILTQTGHQSLPELHECYTAIYLASDKTVVDPMIETIKTRGRTYTVKPVTSGIPTSDADVTFKIVAEYMRGEPPISSFEGPPISSFEDYLRAQGLRISVLRIVCGPDGTSAEVNLSDGSTISTTNKAMIDALLEYSHTA